MVASTCSYRQRISILPSLIILGQQVTISLLAIHACVFHRTQQVTACRTRRIFIQVPCLITTFIAQATCNGKTFHYVILDTTAKLIAITIRNRFLAIQHPVWIGELLLSGICPIVYIYISCPIVHLIVTLIIIPVLSSWKQVSAQSRITHITGSRLVLDMLIIITSGHVYMKFCP